MESNSKTLIVPLLMIAVGSGWLLSATGLAPKIDWVWTLGLAMVGVLTFAVGGLDKFTIVTGPFFLIASVISVMRQSGRLAIEVEVPILVILMGVLLLIARSPSIPAPSWVTPEPIGGQDEPKK